MVRKLPPDPEQLNDDRARWAAAAIASFESMSRTDPEDALADLLADLMHWSDRHRTDRSRSGETFAEALTRATAHYAAETQEIAP